MNMEKWVAEAKAHLLHLSKQESATGFPLDENQVVKPCGDYRLLDQMIEAYKLPPAFRTFYVHCDGIEWADVWNGYWLYGFEKIETARHRGDIKRITGPLAGEVLSIGSNGGGGRLVIRTDASGEVLYLASGGAVQDGVWIGSDSFYAAEVIADTFEGFLRRLLQDLRAYDQGDTGWKYISSH